MRLLLDECIPRKLKNSLQSHECRSVSEEGWAGKKNGELLSLAEDSGFQVFPTIDRGIEYQQNLRPRRIAVLLIRTKSNRLADLLPLLCPRSSRHFRRCSPANLPRQVKHVPMKNIVTLIAIVVLISFLASAQSHPNSTSCPCPPACSRAPASCRSRDHFP